ncbi:MAG: glycosyltransferase [Acidobacteria bacterium]|nr:glycosyltransferase [Acidobacteriota bacterium]
MSDLPLISAVIPAYNPESFLLEAVASVERQSWPHWELIVVDDGSDRPEAQALLASIEQRGDARIRVVHQENRGLAGARNTGFREARGRYVVPLDADDLLEPSMMAVCYEQLSQRPDCGFAYFDYHVFGDFNYLQQPGEYNLYRLLNENFLACCCFVPKAVWEQVGGYDEWHRWGYEDWSFYLRLARGGHYGLYIPQPLFRYRTHGRGLHYTGLDRHASNWAHMEETNPELLSPEGRLRVKRAWAPSVCVVSSGPPPDLSNQTLQDYQVLQVDDEATILDRSPASAFLWVAAGGRLHPQALEECFWGLRQADWVTWKDTGDAPPPSLRSFAGPLGVARRALEWPEPKQGGEVRRLPWRCRLEAPGTVVLASADSSVERPPAPAGAAPQGFWPRLHRHLANAELLSWNAWRRRPLALLLRLIPLRLKERVNAWFGRTVFDLSFYLRFQPRAALIDGHLIERLDYIPPRKTKPRLALVTPHLGVGGAETVLLELARQIDRSRWEVLLLATQSHERRLLPEWRGVADQIYDLEKLLPIEQVPQALYSMALNWELDALIVQNSMAAYGVLPAIEQKRPEIRIADLLHAVDDEWDFLDATLDVASAIDRRLVVSEAGRDKLLRLDIAEEAVRYVPNGVDLRRFDPRKYNRALLRQDEGLPRSVGAVAFIGRLDAVKRPQLLPEIAREIRRTEPGRRVEFLIAGTGPEEEPLASRITALRMDREDHPGVAEGPIGFRLYGHVDEPAQILAMADLLVITSAAEGVPLVALEALAMGVPVVSVDVGAVSEAVTEECGIVVEGGQDEQARLANAILELLADPERRRQMGEAGRARVREHYALENARAGYRALLEELAPAAPSEVTES